VEGEAWLVGLLAGIRPKTKNREEKFVLFTNIFILSKLFQSNANLNFE
jgi:hypothetical protein